MYKLAMYLQVFRQVFCASFCSLPCLLHVLPIAETKGKGIPVRAGVGPEGSRRLRIADI
jgi:hypothetical protein